MPRELDQVNGILYQFDNLWLVADAVEWKQLLNHILSKVWIKGSQLNALQLRGAYAYWVRFAGRFSWVKQAGRCGDPKQTNAANCSTRLQLAAGVRSRCYNRTTNFKTAVFHLNHSSQQ